MTAVARILQEEILRSGPLPFARFMEVALYCPKNGYYEKGQGVVGREGDFYTSVTAGPLFAELLAFQMTQWLQNLGEGQLSVVEAGAHNGQMARNVLAWFRQYRPELLHRLVYWLVEPSEERKNWQIGQLDEFARQIRWVETTESLPPVTGLIFSNELIDAMPVHRLAWDAVTREWRELGVGLEGGHFAWVTLEKPALNISAELPLAGFDLTPELEQVLPHGFIIELSPLARSWWAKAAAKLERGYLLTFDYGWTAEQALVPGRSGGSLRSYKEHRLVADVLLDPGEQDITAHINFTQLQQAGEAAGLKTESFLSQERFLGQIVRQTVAQGPSFGEWTAQRVRQLQVLTHPEHLGRPFQVLVQATQ
jgi:SAM-dependent MidA family methyltransferase